MINKFMGKFQILKIYLYNLAVVINTKKMDIVQMGQNLQ